MSSSGGFVIDAVDTCLFEGFDVYFCSGDAIFFAAVTDKDEFGFLFKGRHVGDVGEADAAAAEDADVGESVKVRESNCAGLHAAHGEASHGTMRLIGDGAEVSVDVGNEVVNEDVLEGGKVKVRTWAWSWIDSIVGPGCGEGVCGAAGGSGEGVSAEFHDDNEGRGFSFGEEVVHDPAGVTLASPAGFVFTRAVLQVERRITLAAVFVVIRWRVNEGVPVCIGGFGKIPELAKLAVRHIFEGVKILVFGREFDGATPASGAVKEMAVRVGNFGAVNIDGVVMKSFIQRPSVAEPCAVVAFCECATVPETNGDGLSFGCDDAEFNAAFGVDLGILFAALIGSGGFPVIGGFVGLRADGLGGEDRNGEEKQSFGFHGVLRELQGLGRKRTEWCEDSERVRQGNDLFDEKWGVWEEGRMERDERDNGEGFQI